jgi:hypothetical protein
VTNVVKTEPGRSLHDEEIAKRMVPGGRLPVRGAKSVASGAPGWQQIGDASPAAVAAAAERHDVRHRPDLVAKRARGGR